MDYLEHYVEELLANGEKNILDKIKYQVIEKVLQKSPSVEDASKRLGITNVTIHRYKKDCFVNDIHRERGKRVVLN